MDRLEALIASPSSDKVERLVVLIEAVVMRLDERRDCQNQIDEINALANGHNFAGEDFFELYSHSDARTWAEFAAMGPAPKIADLTHEELVRIITIIENGEQSKVMFLMDLLERSMPSVWNSNLLFWPTVERNAAELADYLLSAEPRNG
jgi:hypothetical protein